jgi:diguanylate cyclase (GGDEF)-like protein
VRWTLVAFAVVATLATLALLFWSLRAAGETRRLSSRRHARDRRRPTIAGRHDAREALALVGDALAATHNPRALLPVILNVIAEATGARGGQLVHEGEEVGWVGEVGHARAALEFDLSAGGEAGQTTLVLHPPPGGFSDETRKLGEWLSSQAAIALENARLHDVVQRQAITDELTGLVNRRRFLAALEAEVVRARRLGGPLTVVLADLDDFKPINDRFGHHMGDAVLVGFADVIREHVRDVDVAGRLGGEEFALLLPETDLGGAEAGAERLRRSLAEQHLALADGHLQRVTASFGVAQLAAGQSGDELLRAADAALYRAKAAGKNRVSLDSEAPAA